MWLGLRFIPEEELAPLVWIRSGDVCTPTSWSSDLETAVFVFATGPPSRTHRLLDIGKRYSNITEQT